jgi:putative phosphoribosyl transferase
MLIPFRDRADAGRKLAELVGRHLADRPAEGGVVLGLPRGGVPVAAEVARALGWPLDVVLVRKLGVPFQRELAFGAMGEGGTVVLNPDVVKAARVSEDEVARVKAEQAVELERQAALYRRGNEPVAVAGLTALVVDDGMATGATVRAACGVLQARGASRLIVAVPVASPTVVDDFRPHVEIVCVLTPEHMVAVGQWYTDFSQVSDDEVVGLLGGGRRGPAEPC